ncbi:putative O-methyltransferase [Xenorhabdus poinarii G6]|uniref:Putative O-methyltransferase n=1 Tax=Xenorhabdus poinarii G6 TaxID=1354304 RepID=A0A068QZE9_9GAMM|nr:methyltransferase [Xenorhabdus poinarii]CDG20303.1 putative O-methyltransferase [Xenorhabdus poinarii G6]
MLELVNETIYKSENDNLTLTSASDLVKLSDQYRQSAVLHYAIAEKLFDLTQKKCAPSKMAQNFGMVESKVFILLNALVALGLLKKDGNEFLNTELTTRYLTSTSSDYIGAIIEHQYLQWDNWPRMGEILRSETPLNFQQENLFKRNERAQDAFNDAMVRLSQPMRDVVSNLNVFKNANTSIDLAGGHGTYLAEALRHHPQLTGQIWDLPTTRKAAQKTIETYGLSERLRFCEKNLLNSLNFEGEAADIVMLNDCLHYFNEKEVQEIIRCASNLVNPGGTLLILTMTLDENRVTPALSADFSLHMMVNTNHGELHPTQWIARVMNENGLSIREQLIGRYTLLIGQRLVNEV